MPQVRAAEVDSTSSAASAFSAMVLPAGVHGFAATGGFQMRRVANPRYRPPGAALPGVVPGAVSRMRALDRVGLQFSRHGVGAAGVTQWQLQAGEQYRSDDALELTVGGGERRGAHELQALRLAGRRGPLSVSAGDAPPFQLERLAYLNRLRGGVLRFDGGEHGPRWALFGGVPTPVPGAGTAPLRLGAAHFENLRFEEGRLQAAVIGFARGRASLAGLDADSLPGHGGAAALGWSAPVGAGTLAGRIGAQSHNLDGHSALAAQHALEWTLHTPGWAVQLSDERSTARARVVGTDRFSAMPRRENRFNVQSRLGGGRREVHVTGVLREGGDPVLETRNAQIGGSGSLGAGWYAGADLAWDRRGAATPAERRASLLAGGLIPGGHAVLTRLEHASRNDGAGTLTLLGEASLALGNGLRLELEPRTNWIDRQFHQGLLTTRLSWPMAWLASRITGGIAVGAQREQGFRGVVREASLAWSFVPRSRDRADFELRRLDQDGRAILETSASYDAVIQRYETLGGWSATRDTGRVTVRVTRSGNGSGVADLVVSLDGSQLRFTDADGIARFDRVPPGIHVVAVEEQSLPANHQVVTASRVFVTVERGRVPDPVSFTIARAERRTRF